MPPRPGAFELHSAREFTRQMEDQAEEVNLQCFINQG